MKKSDEKQIEAKVRAWDAGLREFWAIVKAVWNEIKLDVNKIIDWYWFSKEKSAGEKALHIIVWFLVTAAVLRLFGII